MANLKRQLAPGPSTAPPAPSTATAPANRMMNFAESSSRQQQAAAANNEDIELPDESDEEEDDDQIAKKSVPAAVFGELGNRAAENREEESSGAQENGQLGALERIKRRRQ
uniref:Uncharacterized protein n=3 Tax=Oryza TaxID=4527 RepID=A0A0E0PMW4_ORYRU